MTRLHFKPSFLALYTKGIEAPWYNCSALPGTFGLQAPFPSHYTPPRNHSAPVTDGHLLPRRIEQLYQNVLALWHHSHINMKSVVSWQYLMTDIKTVRNATVSSVSLPHSLKKGLLGLSPQRNPFLVLYRTSMIGMKSSQNHFARQRTQTR